MQKYADLYSFIDSAVKSRKYAENTAYGFKVAMKLFESELNEHEKESLDEVIKNVDAITQTVYSKNKDRFSAKSIAAYKSRVLKVINDYRLYGSDAMKMANWNPARRLQKVGPSRSKANGQKEEVAETEEPVQTANMQRFERQLRPGVKATVIIPADMTQEECDKISATLASYVN